MVLATMLGLNYRKGNKMITINLEKAKLIKKEALRVDRVELLTDLDVKFQRALESNSDTSAIVSEKQRLRDITLLVDTCESILELDNISLS